MNPSIAVLNQRKETHGVREPRLQRRHQHQTIWAAQDET
jgi:hypothetical protein